MSGAGSRTLADGLVSIERFAGGDLERIGLTIAILAAVVAVRLAIGWLKRREGERTSKQRLLLSSAVAAATAAGVLGVLAVWGLGSALLNALENAAIADHLSNIVLAVVLLASAYALTDFLGGVVRELATESTAVSEHQEEMLRRTIQITVYTLVVLVTIGLFTDNVGSLLVGAGFLGIVVGMAARQTLGAALAGFVLMFSRPFEVGDWVEVGDHEGTVTDISIINTRMRSFDGEVVTIPNDEVRSRPVIDRSRRNRLRIEIEVGVDYDANVNRAAAVLREAIVDIDGIARMPEPDVVTKRFADSAVVLGVRYWITDPSMRKRWRTQTAAMSAIKSGLEHEGITIPFPQQTLSARQGEFGVQLDSAVGRDVARGDGSIGGTGADGAGGGSPGRSQGSGGDGR
ncbi:mechanosensitive ion channel [Halorubrum sp. JWXQ-INN 858]|uniref:mechanosensitive ion channel family protein n=1 Tax=Halorubrum sp. JWXQ-INN 858 TaxID=2690782 RepID=UPI001359998C|nr:mechanosensitive ion channel family protein [Halorubrum sp. JWXQ-INN 858]MWV64727.1 mechanosensitive ion channel [Halorubrum sp. JWXQ-INN 858]